MKKKVVCFILAVVLLVVVALISVLFSTDSGSTRVTLLAQTIQDLDNDEHTAEAPFRQEDDSGLSDIVAQDFTENPTPPANSGGSNLLPIIIGAAVALIAGGGAFVFVIRKKAKATRSQAANQVFRH